MPSLGIVGVEHNLTAGSTWAGGQPLSDDLGLSQGLLVEDGVQQLIELLGLATHDGGLLVDHALVQQVDGNLHHSSTCALTVTSLQEPELALLDGELHILHIVIVVFQLVLNTVQLGIDLRHGLLHRRILGYALLLRDAGALSPALRANLRNLLRRADTGHNVLTLCVDKVLTVEQVLTVGSIAAEANTRSRSVAHVTEYHSHHADSRTPLVGDTFHLTVEDSALVHPAAEHSADSAPELLDRVVGEVLARALLDGSLKQLNQLLQLVDAQVLI